jgi:hypothetical protein
MARGPRGAARFFETVGGYAKGAQWLAANGERLKLMAEQAGAGSTEHRLDE